MKEGHPHQGYVQGPEETSVHLQECHFVPMGETIVDNALNEVTQEQHDSVSSCKNLALKVSTFWRN